MLRAMKAADPAAGPEFDDWASSDAGREVFARIVARRDAPTPRPARRNRPLRLILAASAALVVIALVVGVTITLRDSADEVALSSTTTTVPADAVDRAKALFTVVSLADASSGVENPSLNDHSAEATAERAQALEIVDAADTGRVQRPSHPSDLRAVDMAGVRRSPSPCAGGGPDRRCRPAC